MTKLRIDIRSGLIEVEGDKELAEKVYADFKDIVLERMQHVGDAVEEEFSETTGTNGAGQKTKPKSKPKTNTGPSCASRIEDLKKANFFKSLKDVKAISAALAERAQNYQSNQISAALTSLTKRGALRRIKQDGAYRYQNP